MPAAAREEFYEPQWDEGDDDDEDDDQVESPHHRHHRQARPGPWDDIDDLERGISNKNEGKDPAW